MYTQGRGVYRHFEHPDLLLLDCGIPHLSSRASDGCCLVTLLSQTALAWIRECNSKYNGGGEGVQYGVRVRAEMAILYLVTVRSGVPICTADPCIIQRFSKVASHNCGGRKKKNQREISICTRAEHRCCCDPAPVQKK